MRVTLIALVSLVVLALVGCGHNSSPFDRVEFATQADGKVCAEVWIEAPSIGDCRLEGDAAQDVVSLVHPNGKMALPDRVKFTGNTGDYPQGSVDQSGEVLIAVYHLVKLDDDLEIGYYKRKFARQGNQ